ncbi:MAG: hypothetical protein ABWK01_02450 [Infirmifilum sp.]
MYTMLKKRFTRSIRNFNPRVKDTFILVTLDNLQSLLLVDLLLDVEREYEVQVHHLHLGETIPEEIKQRLESAPYVISQSIGGVKPANYTQVKLEVLKRLYLYPEGALYVLPFTADDLACYFLEELINSNLQGLALEAEARIAYPLYTTTIHEIRKLYPDSRLNASLLGKCTLLYELEGRVALQAFGNFYVEVFTKRKTITQDSCSTTG